MKYLILKKATQFAQLKIRISLYFILNCEKEPKVTNKVILVK